MPFLLLLLLFLACVKIDEWPSPVWMPQPATEADSDVRLATLASWGAMSGVVLCAAFLSWQTRRRLRREPEHRDIVVSRYSKLRFYHLLLLFGVYLLSIYVLGWGWAVRQLATVTVVVATEQVPPVQPEKVRELLVPGAELLLLLPFVAALVLSWCFFYDTERTLHDTGNPLCGLRPFWKRSAYVSFHIRQNLALVLLPIGLLIVIRGLDRLRPSFFVDYSHELQLASAGLFVVMLVCLPWVFRLVLGLEPLPAGPLRDRLLATARRLNFRVSDIMVWNTRLGVANALVVGIFPFLRYVALSDRLIADLSPDELDAVLGHEAGHVKHHHMLYYVGFFMISVLVLTLALDMFFPRAQMNELQLGSLAAYIFLVFGFLSRRCERQADIFGCRAVSCGQANCTDHDELPMNATGRGLCPTGIRIFIYALEKVAALNGISRSRPGWLQSWQHSTIDRRVDFLQQILADPSVEPRFQRRVGLVKWALMISLLSVLGLLWGFEAMRAANPPASPEGATQNSRLDEER